jgi:hypothetical protein
MKEVLTGVGSIQQGLAANASGKYTRKAMKINAANARNDGLETRDRIRTEARRTMGRQLLAQGGSGFQIGTGSALDELRESAIEREIDLATVRRQSEMKAKGFIQQGDLARAQGKSAMIGGFIGGAASFAEGAEKLANFGAGGGGGGAG